MAAGRIEGSARHQRLAAAGRPHHAHIVVAGAGDLKRALGVLLAPNLLEIHGVDGPLFNIERGGVLADDFAVAAQVPHDLAEMGYGVDVDALDERGLGCVGLGHKEAAKSVSDVLDEQGVVHRTISSVEDLLGFEAESAGESVYEETQE